MTTEKYCAYNKITKRRFGNVEDDPMPINRHLRLKNINDIYGVATLTFDEKGRFLHSNPDGVREVQNLDVRKN